MAMRAFVIAGTTMLLAATAQAHTHKFKTLEIVHPWCVETEDTANSVVVSMTIRNTGSKPDRLLRVSAPNTAKTELRSGVRPDAEANVISSVRAESKSEVTLKRGGPHILLTGMKKPLGAYDTFPMTLTFERAGKIEIEVMVEEKSIVEPAKQ